MERLGRYKHKEFAQFVRIAESSEVEVLNHLIDAHDQRLLTDHEFLVLEHDVKRALKASNGLIRYLETIRDAPAPLYKTKANKDSTDEGKGV